MKKPFAALMLAFTLCLSACSPQLAEPKNTPAPTAPEAAATPEPSPTPAPTPTLTPVPVQTQTEPASPQAGPVEAIVESHRLYTRSMDTEGNMLTSGGATFSICGNCGDMGIYMASSCERCGAIYTDREWIEHYETFIRDPNNWDIIYDVSYEPFFVKK